jgi:hypothetical protein
MSQIPILFILGLLRRLDLGIQLASGICMAWSSPSSATSFHFSARVPPFSSIASTPRTATAPDLAFCHVPDHQPGIFHGTATSPGLSVS